MGVGVLVKSITAVLTDVNNRTTRSTIVDTGAFIYSTLRYVPPSPRVGVSMFEILRSEFDPRLSFY